jgi:hypothetical protein
MCSSWLAFRTSTSSFGRASRGNVTRSSLAALSSFVDIELVDTFNSFGSRDSAGSWTKVIRWRIVRSWKKCGVRAASDVDAGDPCRRQSGRLWGWAENKLSPFRLGAFQTRMLEICMSSYLKVAQNNDPYFFRVLEDSPT